jgi:hypothetical protein
VYIFFFCDANQTFLWRFAIQNLSSSIFLAFIWSSCTAAQLTPPFFPFQSPTVTWPTPYYYYSATFCIVTHLPCISKSSDVSSMLTTTSYLSLYTSYVIKNQCWSKASVHGRSLARIVGSNPAGGMDVYCEWCILSGSGLCVGLIARPEESYRLWCVWVWPWSPARAGPDPE